jgi:hypothetical protein
MMRTKRSGVLQGLALQTCKSWQRSGAEAQRAELAAQRTEGMQRRFFWKKSSSYSKWLNKGVKTMTNELEELQQMKKDLDKHIHLAETVSERQKLSDLQNEISLDRKRVAEFRSLAYETSVKNKPEIERLKLQTARLITASIELDNESVMLEQVLKAKYQELTELTQQIEANKNSV